jgi:hypothetical protein
MSVKDIETAIMQLSPDEVAALADWLENFRVQKRTGETLNDISTLYSESLKKDGGLTAFSGAQEDLHDYSAEELAAMEEGQYERPLR